ncbi:hypothetical protein, partial [Enterobacter quasiroggenkampii]|uniref:hypothetical protein n=1 Tax=Enterobacter quasiroggenkampii TaxID=2497436 RepID=UPI0021D0D2B3
FRTMRDLEPHQVREALTKPAAALDVRWDTPPLQQIVERTQGYPYAVQLWGDAMWRAAGSPDPGGVIGPGGVDEAQARVEEDMEAMHRTRWAKASPKEREMLAAMARLGGQNVVRADIAREMGTTSGALSSPRQSLLDKG